MQLSKHDFYILVEGHPNSPELAFFTQAIQKIVDLNGLSNIYPNIVEVGSSSSYFSQGSSFCRSGEYN